MYAKVLDTVADRIAMVAFVTSGIATPGTATECMCDQCEWDAYYGEAYDEYYDEFTALFNSYEVKRARNGALMIRQGNSGSYRFARKGN